MERNENTTVQLIDSINQVFNIRTPEQVEEYYETQEGYDGITDMLNIIAIIPKKETFKKWLHKNFQGIPSRDNLNLTTTQTETATAIYSLTYLQKALEIFEKAQEEKIKITIKKNYPAKLEGEKFTIILAPRVDPMEETK